jgi:hypothetical protein
MAIPLAAAVVAVISLVGIGILKVVKGDHEPSFLIFLLGPTRRIYCTM